jgi:hypothetical protein
MSLQKKMKNAVAAGATEAVERERARCLWILDKIVSDTKEALKDKILTEGTRHFIAMKAEIAEAIALQAKRGIVSGLRPPETLGEMKQEIPDQGEMAQRVRELASVLEELGFDDGVSPLEIRAQIKTWEEQEDRIDELEARLQDRDEG